MNSPIKVAVSGAAGQIAYNLLFRLASGEAFGARQIELHLLEIPQAVKAAEGVVMELFDCAFPYLTGIELYDKAESCFDGVHYALLVGAFPRGAGMQRSDLIEKNAPIFSQQGKALLKADQSVQCLVVGNPCNTNALIALKSAQDIPVSQFFAMTSLDENRAKFQLSQKAQVPISEIRRLGIWGNHSATMVVDYENATIGQDSVLSRITDQNWLSTSFLNTVQGRGAQIIQTRGKSSAASAASACIDHIKRLNTETLSGDFFSAGVYSDGSHYGVSKDIVYSFPISSQGNHHWSVVPGLSHSAAMIEKLRATESELLREREVVSHLLT